MTQRDMVLKYIQESGSITRLDASRDLGIFELSARICELKSRGYKFQTSTETAKNRYGKKFSYTRYRLEGVK